MSRFDGFTECCLVSRVCWMEDVMLTLLTMCALDWDHVLFVSLGKQLIVGVCS